MNDMSIAAPAMLRDGRFTGPGVVRVRDGRIVEVSDRVEDRAGSSVVLGSGVLTPGLLDLQNNGSFGADFADATPAQWEEVLTGLAVRGVTGVQPTIITAPLEELDSAFDRARAAQVRHEDQRVCRILGVHLEGPFISEVRKGAHRAECMLDPTPEALDRLLGNHSTREVLLTPGWWPPGSSCRWGTRMPPPSRCGRPLMPGPR